MAIDLVVGAVYYEIGQVNVAGVPSPDRKLVQELESKAVGNIKISAAAAS